MLSSACHFLFWPCLIPLDFGVDNDLLLRNLRNESFLISSISNLTNVYSSTHRSFTYVDSFAVQSHFKDFVHTYKLVDISMSDFLATSTDQYRYYSGSLLNSKFDALYNQFNLSRYLTMNGAHPTLWMGSAGVHATAHYDSVYNVYVHLSGRKRLRLVPPQQLPDLVLHGCFHPHACQSRLADLTRPADRISSSYCALARPCCCCLNSRTGLRCSDDQQAECHLLVDSLDSGSPRLGVVELSLNPGDVVYIPPFWTHEVRLG